MYYFHFLILIGGRIKVNFQTILSFILLFGINITYAQNIIIKNNQFDNYIGKNISTHSSDKKTTIEEALSTSIEFKKQTSDVPNLGITKKYHWAKFSITNNSDSEKLFLQSDFTSNTLFDVYIQNSSVIKNI